MGTFYRALKGGRLPKSPPSMKYPPGTVFHVLSVREKLMALFRAQESGNNGGDMDDPKGNGKVRKRGGGRTAARHLVERYQQPLLSVSTVFGVVMVSTAE